MIFSTYPFIAAPSYEISLGMMIHEAFYFIKKKVKAHKEKKNQQNADDNERTGDNQ